MAIQLITVSSLAGNNNMSNNMNKKNFYINIQKTGEATQFVPSHLCPFAPSPFRAFVLSCLRPFAHSRFRPFVLSRLRAFALSPSTFNLMNYAASYL
jgi:hypothetical protein